MVTTEAECGADPHSKMRVRTAKKLAQRIDLYYFKRARGLRWWRYALSAALPLIAMLWIGGYAAAGSRRPYSAGPVSSAHAFAERRCEVCHTPAGSFRTHVTDRACLACHDAPAHTANQIAPPACSSCHLEHGGRVQLAKVDDRLCLSCHGDLTTKTAGRPASIVNVGRFPAAHPEFAVLRTGARDPGGLKFNHMVHMKKEGVRGPSGPEQLQCTQCHRPEIVRTLGRRTIKSGLMSPITYKNDCARCHTLFFDERIDAAAPHDTQTVVLAVMRASLESYIARNPGDINTPDARVRRVPLNFPRPAELPARNAAEWVSRRLAFDARVMWNKTCAECHVVNQIATANAYPLAGQPPVPAYMPSAITTRWMPRASFDHTSHQMLRCQSCHAAETSTATADVLMPSEAACATCHAPSKGAETRCFECHQYHDWAKAHAVAPGFTPGDFK